MVKETLTTGLIAVTTYTPKPRGCSDVRLRVDTTGGDISEESVVIEIPFVPEVSKFPE